MYKTSSEASKSNRPKANECKRVFESATAGLFDVNILTENLFESKRVKIIEKKKLEWISPIDENGLKNLYADFTEKLNLKSSLVKSWKKFEILEHFIHLRNFVINTLKMDKIEMDEAPSFLSKFKPIDLLFSEKPPSYFDEDIDPMFFDDFERVSVSAKSSTSESQMDFSRPSTSVINYEDIGELKKENLTLKENMKLMEERIKILERLILSPKTEMKNHETNEKTSKEKENSGFDCQNCQT